MSKRAADLQAVASNPKKSKVQSTLFKFFEKPQEQASSSKSDRKTLDYSPQNYGIYIYSRDEIQKADGLSQEFRKFWNEKAVQLCKDKSVRDKLHHKKAIEGAIYTSWRFQSTHLLQLQAEEVIEEAKSLFSDNVRIEHFVSSIRKNLENMLEAFAGANHLYEVMNTKSKTDEMESDLEKEMTQLKVAQSSLKKAISEKRQQIRVEQAVIQHEAECLTTGPPEMLSEEDMEVLVETFKTDLFEEQDTSEN